MTENDFNKLTARAKCGGWLNTEVTILSPDGEPGVALAIGHYVFTDNAYSCTLYRVTRDMRLQEVQIDI